MAQEKLQMSHSFSLISYKTNHPRAELVFFFFFVGIMISFQVLFTMFVPAVLLTAKQAA